MMSVVASDTETPSPAEIRAELDRMVATEPFQGSPQLVAFLRFVVETTLRGDGDRLKGYTIALEALGRDDRFDPQTDPIVRVEAARLRRAIERYYAGPGAGDPIVIELQRGHYMPVFRRNADPNAATALAARTGRTSARLALYPLATLILIGIATTAIVWQRWPHPGPPATTASAPKPPPARQSSPAGPPAGSPMPLVYVMPFEMVGTPVTPGVALGTLRGKLRDAFARFDEIDVVSELPAVTQTRTRGPTTVDEATAASEYRLAATAEFNPDGSTNLAFRLLDAGDGTVVWSRTLDRIRAGTDPGHAEDAITREVVTTLAQPYGILQARERAKRGMSGNGDRRYRCLLDAFDYWRSYEPAAHAAVRECLEQATARDPTFANGFAALAAIYLDEQRNGFNLRPGDAPAVERALKVARRAVELKPGSARAHQALLDAHFVRREFDLAVAAGEKAVRLNPYDPDILADLGARLVALGQVDRGVQLLHEASTYTVVRPPWQDFYLFLGAYLNNDMEAATRHAALIMTDTFPLGVLARVLSAAKNGDRDRARVLMERLVQLDPTWRVDARRQLQRYFPDAAIVDRLAGDLADIARTGTL